MNTGYFPQYQPLCNNGAMSPEKAIFDVYLTESSWPLLQSGLITTTGESTLQGNIKVE